MATKTIRNEQELNVLINSKARFDHVHVAYQMYEPMLDLFDDKVAALYSHVRRRLSFAKPVRFAYGVNRRKMWHTLASVGFQAYETVLDVYKPNTKAQVGYDYTDSRYLDYVMYSAVYGSTPDTAGQLLKIPAVADKNIKQFYELMSGAADLSIYGAPDFPNIEFIGVDLDETANAYANLRAANFGIRNFRTVKRDITRFYPPYTKGVPKENRVAYIGKQSLNYFDSLMMPNVIRWLVKGFGTVILETLPMPETFAFYKQKHECDWLHEDHILNEVHTSTLDGCMPENPFLGTVSFTLYHERPSVDKKSPPAFYKRISTYDWNLYSTQEIIREILRADGDPKRIHINVGSTTFPLLEYNSKKHHRLYTSGSAITVIYA